MRPGDGVVHGDVEVAAHPDRAVGRPEDRLRPLGTLAQARLQQVGVRRLLGVDVQLPHSAAAGEAGERGAVEEQAPGPLADPRGRVPLQGLRGAVAGDQAARTDGEVRGVVRGEADRVDRRTGGQGDLPQVGAVRPHVEQGAAAAGAQAGAADGDGGEAAGVGGQDTDRPGGPVDRQQLAGVEQARVDVRGVGGDGPDVALAGGEHPEVLGGPGGGVVLPHPAARIGARVEDPVRGGREAPYEAALAAEGLQVRDRARGGVVAVQAGIDVRTDVDLAARQGHRPCALGRAGAGAVGNRGLAHDGARGEVVLGEDRGLPAAGDDVTTPLVHDGADDRAGGRGRAEAFDARGGAVGGVRRARGCGGDRTARRAARSGGSRRRTVGPPGGK